MDNQKPLVSVILPVHNAEDFIEASIRSILNQTISDFELIIINDGSNDTSDSIIKEAIQGDSRVRYFSRENKGLVATLNEGIELSRGKWIARMDADDISLPNRLEIQLRELKERSADVCGTWIRRFGNFESRIVKPPIADNLIKLEMLFSCPFAHPSIIASSEVMKDALYDLNWSIVEDYDLWVRLAIKGVKMINVPQSLLDYRVHSSQVSSRFKESQEKLTKKVQEKYWSSYKFNFYVSSSTREDFLNINQIKNTKNIEAFINSFWEFATKEEKIFLTKKIDKIFLKRAISRKKSLIEYINIYRGIGLQPNPVQLLKILLVTIFGFKIVIYWVEVILLFLKAYYVKLLATFKLNIH